jgi:hypothetical protein
VHRVDLDARTPAGCDVLHGGVFRGACFSLKDGANAFGFVLTSDPRTDRLWLFDPPGSMLPTSALQHGHATAAVDGCGDGR